MSTGQRGFQPVDEVVVDPRRARVYEHGWQSWSPTSVLPAGATSARPSLGWQQVMRFRPGSPLPVAGFQGEGLLVVDPGNDGPVRTYAATDPGHDVPSIRARLDGDRVMVSADGATRLRATWAGLGTALGHYGDDLRSSVAQAPLRPAPTVWCSWYHYFLDVTEADIVENAEAMARLDLPVDVVQVDDGWQAEIGDWTAGSTRFPSLDRLAQRIHDTGRRAGIWLAPFIVGERSALARDHPEWLLGDAGHNWDQRLSGLDLSHPGAQEHLWTAVRNMRDAGYDYFKLDFLYAGALPGARHGDLTGVQAYRVGLEVLRDAAGEESYLLGCGAPLLPSVGLVDAMRVSPDTYNPVVPEVSDDPLRGRAGVEARAWQQGRLWVNDADALVVRPVFGLRREWADVVERYGGLRSFSDRVADLDDWGLGTVRRLLSSVPPPVPFVQLPDAYPR
ncbi:MAG TPA: glycoside hydrolase family 36 protein [Nocardioidaceae bacterium]|nr:glycoside hydrolase family 36 protein [Nocardioidaceae bacterium]